MSKRKAIADISPRHLRRLIKNAAEKTVSKSEHRKATEENFTWHANKTTRSKIGTEDIHLINYSQLYPHRPSHLNKGLAKEHCYHESPTAESNKLNFRCQIAQWAVEHDITHSGLSALLRILKQHECHVELPVDARTILQTPKTANIRDVPPGTYYHFGIKNNLCQIYDDHYIISLSEIEISINVYGLPLSKSSRSCCWPILGCVVEHKEIFTIGLYHGNEKPSDVNQFLIDFVEEAKYLSEFGINLHGKLLPFSIKHIICDAPAKAFILGTKGHGGYSSCSKCITEGEYRERRVCFPELNAQRRSDNDFKNLFDEEYHVKDTILRSIPRLNLVTNVTLDYMHLVCLGVMRKLLQLWIKGDLSVRLQHKHVKRISDKLIEIQPHFSAEFARKPRSLDYLNQWKATEFRSILLYTGPVVFKNILPLDMYNHFNALHVSFRMRISSILKNF